MSKYITNIKKAWIALNLLFIANYTLYISRLLVSHPLRPLSNIFNNTVLVLTYALTLYKFIVNFTELPAQPNFYCLITFTTFPHNILLFPFYLLAIYHVTFFVVQNRRQFERQMYFGICAFISTFHVTLSRVALFVEILCVPMSVLLVLFKCSNVATVMSYVIMVRHQYLTNSVMRSVFGEMRVYLDNTISSCPKDFQNYYIKSRNFLIDNHKLKNN